MTRRAQRCSIALGVRTCALTLLVVMAPALVVGQSRATGADLTGLVTDRTQSVLRGASVTVVDAGTNVARAAETDAAGRFTILALPPGVYRLRVEAPGFQPSVMEDLQLTLGAVVDVALTLDINGIQQRVVIAAASAVDSQNTAVSHTVTQPQIDALPIDRRNFIGFTIITPGVTTDRIPQPSQGATPTSGLTFAGQRPRSNNVMVDGLDNNSTLVGSIRASFSQEAVREFQVLTDSYSAEFGKASGGVINIVTRSGTNTVRGSGFFFLRDRSLDAKGYFERFDPSGRAIDQAKAPFRQHQGGGVLGGPLKRDRTFYFLSFERLRVTASNFVTIDDTTQVADPISGASLGTPVQILTRAGFPVETGNVLYGVRSDQALARVDHQINGRQYLNVRFNMARSLDENTEAFGGLIARSRAGALKTNEYNAAFSYTWSPSDRSVNEWRTQWADGETSLLALDPSCIGPCDEDEEGGPTLEVLGVATVGRARNTPGRRRSVQFEIVDTFTRLAGNHQFKTGIDFSRINYSTYHLPLNFGGRYIFGPLPAMAGVTPVPVSAIQAVALGLPSTYVQGYGNTDGPFLYKDLSLFAQDDWRLTPRLTLKFGVRYQNQFWPDVSYDVSGYPGRYGFPSDNNNLAPRVGVAWDPTGSRTTSVHAAYGIFYANNPSLIVPVSQILDGQTGVRTMAVRAPQSIEAWNAPGHRLPAAAVGSFPSVRFSIDPAMKTPYAHQFSAGVDRQLGALSLGAALLYVRGFNDLGTIDYNPIVPSLGTGRRPEDVDGVAGTSASILQYTSFGRSSYRGLTVSASGRLGPASQLVASYTLSKSEDNSTDFQSAFVVQDTGRGRDPANPDGLPIGFNPDLEYSTSTQDQRHRLVVSGVAGLPASFQASWVFTLASGRPFNILAGADLNGDGNGGSFPSDRARRDPADPSTSLPRNAGRLPAQATLDVRLARRLFTRSRIGLDLMIEGFNLFNRTNFIEVNNIFGTGRYPDDPLSAYGLYQQAGPPRQIQLGARVSF